IGLDSERGGQCGRADVGEAGAEEKGREQPLRVALKGEDGGGAGALLLEEGSRTALRNRGEGDFGGGEEGGKEDQPDQRDKRPDHRSTSPSEGTAECHPRWSEPWSDAARLSAGRLGSGSLTECRTGWTDRPAAGDPGALRSP